MKRIKTRRVNKTETDACIPSGFPAPKPNARRPPGAQLKPLPYELEMRPNDPSPARSLSHQHNSVDVEALPRGCPSLAGPSRGSDKFGWRRLGRAIGHEVGLSLLLKRGL